MPSENAIVSRSASALTPMEMIDRALTSGASVETLDKLMALQERWEANQARKAFDQAIAAARAQIPPIIKNREVDFTTGKGRTNYAYEDFAAIARTVDPILSQHGLSYRFRTAQEGPNITVTCILSHSGGYSETTSLTAGRDESGNKNSIQAVGSTATYLQRYTLKASLGLSVSHDDDAAAAAPEPAFDLSPWRERIVASFGNPSALRAVAADLKKAGSSIPPTALATLRKDWGEAMRQTEEKLAAKESTNAA